MLHGAVVKSPGLWDFLWRDEIKRGFTTQTFRIQNDVKATENAHNDAIKPALRTTTGTLHLPPARDPERTNLGRRKLRVNGFYIYRTWQMTASDPFRGICCTA